MTFICIKENLYFEVYCSSNSSQGEQVEAKKNKNSISFVRIVTLLYSWNIYSFQFHRKVVKWKDFPLHKTCIVQRWKLHIREMNQEIHSWNALIFFLFSCSNHLKFCPNKSENIFWPAIWKETKTFLVVFRIHQDIQHSQQHSSLKFTITYAGPGLKPFTSNIV